MTRTDYRRPHHEPTVWDTRALEAMDDPQHWVSVQTCATRSAARVAASQFRRRKRRVGTVTEMVTEAEPEHFEARVVERSPEPGTHVWEVQLRYVGPRLDADLPRTIDQPDVAYDPIRTAWISQCGATWIPEHDAWLLQSPEIDLMMPAAVWDHLVRTTELHQQPPTPAP